MSFPNALANKDIPQSVSWSHFIESREMRIIKKDKPTEYDFELIQPLLAITFQYKDQGSYYIFPAVVNEDQKLNIQGVIKGEMVLLNIPAATFERAWWALNYTFRKSINDNDNVRLKFIKAGYQHIHFLDVERMVCTKEQEEFARKSLERAQKIIDKSKRYQQRYGSSEKKEESIEVNDSKAYEGDCNGEKQE